VPSLNKGTVAAGNGTRQRDEDGVLVSEAFALRTKLYLPSAFVAVLKGLVLTQVTMVPSGGMFKAT